MEKPQLHLPFDVWRRRILIGVVYLYVGLLVMVPVVGLVVGALGDGLGGVLKALSSPGLQAAFGRTILIAAVVLVVHTLFGTAVAWVLVRHKFPGRSIINAAIDLPFAVSAVVVGYMLLLLFGRNGLFGPLLQSLGIQVAFAMPGLILATLFVTLPFMIRELMPVLEAFGVEQEQAAATLGASGWQTFWMVTFPAIRWGFLYGLTLTFARALGEFGAVLVIGGGIFGKTDTATIFIYQALEGRGDVQAYAASLVLGLLSLLLVIGLEALHRKQEVRG